MSLKILTMGGAGGESATIFVTGLSESDTVTATNGEKAKPAVWNSTESRHEIAKIKDYGMWTVTATNGADFAEQNVLIDIATVYEIDITYAGNYLMLYDCGDECEDVTGGWRQGYYSYGNSSGTWTKNDDHLYVYNRSTAATGSSNFYINFHTINSIDIDDYNMAGVIWNCSFSVDDSSATFRMGTFTSNSMSNTYGIGDMVCGDSRANRKAMTCGNLNKSVTRTQLAVCARNTKVGVKAYAVCLTKADNWESVIEQAGLTVPESLSVLFTDSESVSAILNNKSAVYSMFKCTGDFMIRAIASDVFLAALETSPYKSFVLTNRHWSKFLAMVGVTA